MIRGTHTRTQTDKEADRRSGSEAKEQRAEEAFGTPGDRGIDEEKWDEKRKRGQREEGGRWVLTACVQLHLGPP